MCTIRKCIIKSNQLIDATRCYAFDIEHSRYLLEKNSGNVMTFNILNINNIPLKYQSIVMKAVVILQPIILCENK